MQLSIEYGCKRFITLVANARSVRRSRLIKSHKAMSGPEEDAKIMVWWTVSATLTTRRQSGGLAKTEQWHLDYYRDEPTVLDMVMDDMTDQYAPCCRECIQAITGAARFRHNTVKAEGINWRRHLTIRKTVMRSV